MKPYLIFVFLTLSLSANAGDSLSYSNQKWSVGIHSRIYDLRLHSTFNFGRHQIGAGINIDKIPRYDFVEYTGPYTHGYRYSLFGQTGVRIRGGHLFYRIYPFRPRESFSFYLENYVNHSFTRLHINGTFSQRMHQLTEAVLFGARYKFLERFSIYMNLGPAVTFSFAKESTYQLENGDSFKFLEPTNYHMMFSFGFEVGIK